jgi:hypothetical protein
MSENKIRLLATATVVVIFGLITATCGVATRQSEARRTVERSGLSDVKAGGLNFWECGQNDKIGRDFTATNTQGARVSGVVCCGYWKSCTIRW